MKKKNKYLHKFKVNEEDNSIMIFNFIFSKQKENS